MNLTNNLVEEHKLIKRMINVLEKAVNHLEKNKNINLDVFEKAVDFIKNFADKFHHAKEEDILFKEMIRKGMPEKDSPIEAMLIEHEKGREFVKGIIKARDNLKRWNKKAVDGLIKNAKGYIDLLREHIEKEDDILYPLAERMFTNKEKGEQNEMFKKASLRKGGQTTVVKYEKMVISLEKNKEVDRMVNKNVDKDMTLGDVVQKFPHSAGVMMKYGLHCIGCHVASWETIEQGAAGHGMNKKEIDKMVEDINKAINKSDKTKIYHASHRNSMFSREGG